MTKRHWAMLVSMALASTLTASMVLAAPPQKPVKKPGDTTAPASPTTAKSGAGTKGATATTKPAKAVATAAQSVSRSKERLDEIEIQIAELLVAPPPGTVRDQRVTNAKIDYRMVLRQLYELAEKTKSDELRVLAMLKADTLANGMSAFDNMVSQVPKWATLAASTGGGAEQDKLRVKLNQALNAITAFDKAAEKANQSIEKTEELKKYLTEMFSPLEPAVLLELGDETMPVGWPVLASKKAVVNPDELPSVEQTTRRIQDGHIMSGVQNELLAIMPKLQAAMASPETRDAAADQYKLMLDCLSLAEQIQQSRVLITTSKDDLNQQLLLGLVLFKDQRTRNSALGKLNGIGNVATVMMHLENSPMTPAQRQTVGEVMQGAVQKLNMQTTAKAGRSTLQSIDKFLVSYEQFIKAGELLPTPTMRDEWSKLKNAGDKITIAAMDEFKKEIEDSKIDEYAKRFGQVRGNLERLAAMPDAAKAAEVYKPRPADGVTRKMTVWSRAIAENPEVNSTAGTDFDTFREALSLLGEIRGAFSTEQPDTLVQKLTGDKFGKFREKFLATEQNLIRSLAELNSQSGPLVNELKAQYKLLRTLQDMVALENEAEKPLAKLNQWGAWELEPAAMNMLREQCEQALTAEFLAVTNSNSPTAKPATDGPMVNYAQAGGAMSNLATIYRRIGGKLNAKPDMWAATYVQITKAPEANAAYANLMDKLAQSSWEFNEASCNIEFELNATAEGLFKKAMERLNTMTLPAE